MNVSEILRETLSHRFEDLKHDFFINKERFDPRNWFKDRNFGIPMIEFLSEQLKVPLAKKRVRCNKRPHRAQVIENFCYG